MTISNYLSPEQLQLMLNNTFGDEQNYVRQNPLQFQYPFIPGGITTQFDPRNFQSIFPSNITPMPQEQTGITSTDQAQNFEFLKSAYEDQDEDAAQFLPGQELEEYETDRFGYRKEPNFLQELAQYIPFVGEKSLSRAIINQLPKVSPEARNIRNFYGSQYGLDSIGRVASGIMKGYNPVSGGFLNKITGGRFGQPTQYGLAPAIQKRISNILGRKIAQTDISRARVKELRDLRDREIRDRADFGESLSSIGKSTFTGKGQAFEKQDSGTGRGPR